jgi:carboxymethylenebutenolidase
MAPREKPDRMKADEFPREVLDLFDSYVHGRIDRRGFLDGAARFAVGGMSAAVMLDKLRPNYAWARQVPAGDPRIRDEYIEYASPQGHGTVRGLLVKPTSAPGPWPAVLVIHENRGLNPYVEDVVRRMGAAGFLALGPDALTSLGGYPGTDEEGVAMQRQLDGAKVREDFVAGAEYLMSHAESTGRVGAVGFCFGGGVVGMLAVRLPALAAGVPFYGTPPSPEDVGSINAPLLVNLAENDARINDAWPATEAALRAAGKQVTIHTYPGTNHGFHNDTTPRYDEAAARLAQQRTIEFFDQQLRG